MKYWLLKSEPTCYGIDDLAQAPEQTTHWDGVRNYQARNMMRDEMKPGDLAFFYHSKTKVPGIAGIVTISSEAYPDHTAFDPESEHPDPKSTPDNPRWFMVDVTLKETFDQVIPLQTLKQCPELDGMVLLQKGSRLSVMPVEEKHWDFICQKCTS